MEPPPTQPSGAGAAERPGAQDRVLVGRLLRAADRAHRLLAAAVEPHGITVQQYNVLRILRGALPDPLPTYTVAERMVEQAPGISRLLDRIEAKRLIRRERCSGDRRQVLCSVTDEGLALLDLLEEPTREVDRRLLADLSSGERSALSGLLARVDG